MKTLALLILTCLALAACESPTHILQSSPTPERPSYGSNRIPVVPVDVVNPDPRGKDGGVVISDDTPGTWVFTAPTTVTQVERKTNDIDQFTLFMGVPQPNDTPFMTITVTRDRTPIAEADPDTYKITNTREYTMNTNFVKEWTGTLKSGAGFSELIVRKPGTADKPTASVCHAIAHARNESEQKTALSILSTITWKPQNP